MAAQNQPASSELHADLEESDLLADLDEAKRLSEKAGEYYEKGQYDAALPLAEKALQITQRALGPDRPFVATALINLAVLHRAKGDYDRALPLYERSLAIREKALGSHHPSVASSLNILAGLHNAKGDYDRALPLVERSLAIREKTLGPYHPDVATSLTNLAALHKAKGDYDRALPLIERSLAIREKILGPYHPDVASSLNNLATLYQDKGDYGRALALYERAVAIDEKTLGPYHLDLAMSLNNLAALYQDRGDHERALPLYERSLAIREKILGPYHPDVASSLNNLAGLYQDKGDYERALPLYERSLAIEEKVRGPHHPEVAIHLNNLAVLHWEKGDYDRALPLVERSLAIREKALGPHHPSVAASLNVLTALYQDKGDYDRALPLAERSLAILEEALGPHHPSVAASLNNVALLHWARGRGAEAVHHTALYQDKGDYDRALPLAERSLAILEEALGPHHPSVAASLNNVALLHWARGRGAEAVHHLQRAMDARDAHISLVSTGDSARSNRLLLAQYSSDVDATVTFALEHEHPQARRLALATLLSRKGRVLDSMSDAFASVRSRLGPDEQKLLDEYRANRTSYARQLLRGPEQISEARHRSNLAALEQRANELERLIAARSNEFRGQLRSVAPEAVQTVLPEGAVLVEWVRYRKVDPKAAAGKGYSAERYAVSILAKTGEPVWLDLGEAKPIDAAIAAWRSALARQLATAGTLARELDALIMAPVRAHLGNATNIFLAPDGLLHLVPFAALVDEQGRYLAERYLFTYLTSGRDLMRLQDQKGAAAQSPPLIMADPHYHIPGQPDSQSFEPLRHVLAEAQAVQSLFPDSTLLTGAQATEAALKQARGPALVHIATHGYFTPMTCGAPADEDSDASLQSGLALAGANACRSPDATDSSGDDGLLTALEAASLDLYGTELAVLSACDTGIGTTELRDEFLDRNIGRGEGIYGLRRALVLAGARTQMLSLWRVDDAQTRQLMTMYYRKLAEGIGRAEALRQVQLELLRSEEWSQPYYWASFIVSGDPSPLPFEAIRTIPPVQRGARGCACDIAPATPHPAWPGSALLMLLGLLLCRRMRRHR